jgi:hypothetical protein
MQALLPSVIAAALAPLTPPPDDARTATYRALLRRHDWTHEFSEELRWVQRGRAELAELQALQKEVDPDFHIWNTHCHRLCKDGAAYPAFPFV